MICGAVIRYTHAAYRIVRLMHSAPQHQADSYMHTGVAVVDAIQPPVRSKGENEM